MSVELPEAWDAVSQGGRTLHEIRDGRRHVTWSSPQPMDEVYLIAARFVEYSRPAGEVTAYAYLREADPNLASKYLEATVQYIEMYRKMIGPYPYDKFALVENFWDTGYGMPSFTLLGSMVIRFPFILHSSYPHEILHNWWGNSVFVDYDSGNWCEGLTAYLADHLVKEGQGQGVAYRRDTLKRYRNYVRGDRDFPLTEFRSRHNSATEAVGYGKSLMLWHMLRRPARRRGVLPRAQLGSTATNRFRRASFDDLQALPSRRRVRRGSRRASSTPVGRSDRRGRNCELGEVTAIAATARAPLSVRRGAPGAGRRAVLADGTRGRFTLDGSDDAEEYPHRTGASTDRVGTVGNRDSPGRTRRIDVDPWFDLFRRLDPVRDSRVDRTAVRRAERRHDRAADADAAAC